MAFLEESLIEVIKRFLMSEYFEYSRLESGIHRFRWLDMSTKATSSYFDCITLIYDELSTDQQVVRILHDYQYIQFIPSSNIFGKTRSLQSMYPHLDRRIAYISNHDITEFLIYTLTYTVNRTGTRRFFQATQAHLAIEWLLSED